MTPPDDAVTRRITEAVTKALEESEPVTSPQEARRLAREEPDRFNELFEAGLIDPAALSDPGKKEDR